MTHPDRFEPMPPVQPADVDPPRPRAVTVSFVLWVVNAGLWILSAAIVIALGSDALRQVLRESSTATGQPLSEAQLDTAVTSAQVFTGVFAGLILALTLFFGLKMRAGRNWARTTLTVLGVIYTLYLLYTLATGAAGLVDMVIIVCEVAVVGTAVYLMWQAEARPYFARR
ncbi:hypothetical protein [Actinokineospora bangkokensis]|uniref:DUF2127 domain-containing protein n=1 Tax=Actinokineospora bangkokensis TaxID=1193682 RepID=A0A1Q9LFF5_9PSEU|nr:hypothetical protein [Actinokineospora bangkokensis]OLR90735.1 hypothetical protein BJP25_29530 [Actinokineospora bangkokensis]